MKLKNKPKTYRINSKDSKAYVLLASKRLLQKKFGLNLMIKISVKLPV
jgi:hypothetical protein